MLALAGVAAAVATRGPLRRAVGRCWRWPGAPPRRSAYAGCSRDPFAVDVPASGLPQLPPGTPVELVRGQPVELTAAPLLVLAGAALLLAAGLFVLLAEPRLAHLGARYGTRRERRAEPDPDRAAWLELDAGRDPTARPRAPAPGAVLTAALEGGLSSMVPPSLLPSPMVVRHECSVPGGVRQQPRGGRRR